MSAALLQGRGAPAEAPGRLVERAAFLREMSASLRAGLTLHAALAEWADDAPGDAARRVRTAARLHLSRRVAVHHLRGMLGSDTEIVLLAASVHSRLGGDLAALLEAVAGEVEMRAEDLRAARAHAAGVLASARTIAFLPLGGLVATRLLGGAPTGGDLVLGAAGIGLGVAGFRWLNRLLPRPPPQHPRETVPAILVVAVAAGIPLGAAMDALVDALHDPDLDRARRAVRLGLRWDEALLRSRSETLVALGRALHQRALLGLPLEDALRRHIHARRIAARREHEEALRRAPVRMIVPLTLCVLPGFVLVTFGPLVRALLSQT